MKRAQQANPETDGNNYMRVSSDNLKKTIIN